MVQGITSKNFNYENRLWPKIISTSNTYQTLICELPKFYCPSQKSLTYSTSFGLSLGVSFFSYSYLFYILKNVSMHVQYATSRIRHQPSQFWFFLSPRLRSEFSTWQLISQFFNPFLNYIYNATIKKNYHKTTMKMMGFWKNGGHVEVT